MAQSGGDVKPRPLRESDIKKYLLRRVKAMGGEARKVRWEGRSNAPDWVIMLPGVRSQTFTEYRPDRTVWAELKAPGKPASAAQLREHARMRKMGQRVEVVDSYERVEEILK